jgi:hypothetical protein
MDGPLYLDGCLDEPLEAFFQLMVIYTHLDDHIDEPLEMLLGSPPPSKSWLVITSTVCYGIVDTCCWRFHTDAPYTATHFSPKR